MGSRTFAASAVLTLGLLAGCTQWESGEHGITYTFTNHCGEDLVVTTLDGGATVALADGEVAAVRTFAQEPDEAFVVTRADGTDDVQVAPGTATYALEGDDCPSDQR